MADCSDHAVARIKRFRDRADECRALAELANSADARVSYLNLAKSDDTLVAEREATRDRIEIIRAR